MSYLSVTKFDEYQHYKNRKPPWVKFYVSLLDPHHPLNELPIVTRYVFDRLLLLAAEYDNAIPNDSELIAKLLRVPPGDCAESLASLEKGRWIKVTRTKRRASKGASKIAPPETEREAEKEPPYSPPSPTPETEWANARKAEKEKLNGKTGYVHNLSSYTGVRIVRGEVGITHVYDPLGTEPKPTGWPYQAPSRQEVAAALLERGDADVARAS